MRPDQERDEADAQGGIDHGFVAPERLAGVVGDDLAQLRPLVRRVHGRNLSCSFWRKIQCNIQSQSFFNCHRLDFWYKFFNFLASNVITGKKNCRDVEITCIKSHCTNFSKKFTVEPDIIYRSA
jgi:hypothetical protein